MLTKTRAVLTNIDDLANKSVAVIGLGGVGSFAATSLARSGLGKIYLVDFDIIELSNINRQEFALQSTLGTKKTQAAYNYIKDINPKIDCCLIEEKIDDFTEDVDFIVDAIDDIPAKINLAKHKNIISCMGTAQRYKPEYLKYADIYDTSVCPLCKVVRKKARLAGIKQLKVVYSTEVPVKKEGILGSTAFVPSVAGIMLASYVVRSLI